MSLYVTTPLWLLPSLAKAFDPWLIFRVHFLAIRFQGNMARLSSFCSQFKSWTWNYSLSTQTVGILALRDPLHFWKKKHHFYLVSCNCFLIFFSHKVALCTLLHAVVKMPPNGSLGEKVETTPGKKKGSIWSWGVDLLTFCTSVHVFQC